MYNRTPGLVIQLLGVNMTNDEPWYGVRCIFDHGASRYVEKALTYEERIIVVKAESLDSAIIAAEKDAEEYASDVNASYLGHSQAFHIYDGQIAHGSEVFSLMRDSSLSPDDYIDHFFSTGMEREQSNDN